VPMPTPMPMFMPMFMHMPMPVPMPMRVPMPVQVEELLKDPRMLRVRQRNAAPNAAGITRLDMLGSDVEDKVRPRVLRRPALAVPGLCARVSSGRRRRLWAAHPSQRKRSAHWAPSNRLGCPSQPTRPRRQPALPPPPARAGASRRVRLPRV
jgi:hypothetical protein